ncbi:hypothetical protein [Massilia sp. X63]|uniref:hypothetical protein n=1 Tax=Massilia sp. X63 TaxID=3237285 RepID=UPI0034DD3A37
MPTTPPTISAAPAAPQRNVKATFSDRVDAFVTWLVTAVSQFAAVANNVYNNAVETYNSAVTASTAATTATDAAAAAVATANATLWVSGQTVAQDANKISPLTRLTYRRKTAAGSGTTDPSLDPTNYVPLSSALVQMFTSADQTFTANGSLTIAHGLGVVPKIVLFFARDTVTGRVYSVPCVVYYGEGTAFRGATVTADAANIYIVFSSNPPNIANGVYFVRAFV